jgi:hypothetical protein
MDRIELATSVVGLLAPYVDLGEGASESSDGTDPQAMERTKRVYEVVKNRLQRSPYAAGQLAGLEERPRSPGRQEALRSVLGEVLEEDPEFAAYLEQLVSEILQITGARGTTIYGGAVAGRDVYQMGQYVAGRDMTIGSPPPATKEER